MRLVSTVVLTRILAPDAFALIGISATFLFVMEMITDVGFRGYILKHENIRENRFLDNLWTLQVIRGFVLYFILLLAAYPISLFFDIDGLLIAVIITSHGLILKGVCSLAPFLADRRNNAAKPMLIRFLANALSTTVIISTAAFWESKWCIIVGQLYVPLITTVLSYLAYSNSRHSFHFNKEQSKQFWQWSKFIMPSSIMTIAITQSDKAFLGKTLSEESLGLYYIALNLAMIAETFVIDFARRVISPALSHKRHSDEGKQQRHSLADVFYWSKNKIILLMSCGLGLACGFTELIVTIVYDDRYAYVAVFLSILLVRPALALLSYPIESMLMVQGIAKSTLHGNIARLAWITIFVYPLYVNFGDIGAVATFVTMEFAAVIYFFIAAYKHRFLRIQVEILNVLVFGLAFGVAYWLQPTIISLVRSLLPV